ncbi:MAG: cytochrome c family protein [Phenylobacterium sp.]|nr:cytochrome c family protein [Phenylobacterium sp.]
MRLGPILAATTLCLAAAACGQAPETAGGDKPEAPKLTDAEKQAVLASYPAPYNTADLANGKSKFALCQSCHTVTPGGANMTGPNLHGVFGQPAASKAGYKYSDALKATGWVWDATHLDNWLAKPQTYVPGTKMSFAGVHDAKDRSDLIAYLMVETGYRVP